MRSKIRTYILFIALGVLMSSCITSRKTNYLQDSGIDIEQYKRIDSMYLHDDYRLQGRRSDFLPDTVHLG